MTLCTVAQNFSLCQTLFQRTPSVGPTESPTLIQTRVSSLFSSPVSSNIPTIMYHFLHFFLTKVPTKVPTLVPIHVSTNHTGHLLTTLRSQTTTIGLTVFPTFLLTFFHPSDLQKLLQLHLQKIHQNNTTFYSTKTSFNCSHKRTDRNPD